tara:strand:- start:382 stop:783 length:402 start_codon:yes stop_codon:yes gene_type:complete
MDLEIIKIASDTRNNRPLKNYTHKSKLKSSFCGDEIIIKLIMVNNKVKDFTYEGKSCVYCQASASLLSKNSLDKDTKILDELCNDTKLYFDEKNDLIKKKWKFLNKLLKKKNLSRKECILLPFKTLKKIVTVL